MWQLSGNSCLFKCDISLAQLFCKLWGVSILKYAWKNGMLSCLWLLWYASIVISPCYLYASAAYAAPEAFCCCLVFCGFHPMPNIFLSLHKNTVWILMKFTRGNHYHKQIKWLHFGWNWNGNIGIGDDTIRGNMRILQVMRECSNRCQLVLPRCQTGVDI